MTFEDIDSAPTDVKKLDNHETNINGELTEKEETPTVTESENNDDKPLDAVDPSNVNGNLSVEVETEKTNADVDDVSEQKDLPSDADVDNVSEQKEFPLNADVDVTSEPGVKTDDATERGFSGFDLNEDVSSDETDPGLTTISEPEKQRLDFDLNVSDDELPLDLNSPQSPSFRNFDLNSGNDDMVPLMGKLINKHDGSVISIFGTQVGVNRNNDPSTDFSLGQSGFGNGAGPSGHGFDLNGSSLGGKRHEPDGGFEGSAVNYKRQQQ